MNTIENNKLNKIEDLLTILVNLIQIQLPQTKTNGLFTQKELLEVLKISPNTLKSWERKGLPRLEPPIEGTRTVFYKLDDVLKFLTL
ncbi:helix-turn-helix transcriptional regulator [Streptococcus uberis]|uniref:helix-turn-helix transcriptional regulator n=1 Tax=Streptococcus uberis TaxID=1349 RepID=UPI0012B595A9|nr:MerR family transcriptional regulator [Streptococcus uberis]MTB35407.1 MerR family transcriptional regulator [Streptococcus uberis]MTB56642.1 MerR family transcriptional regulator [Streptococcus uberis]